MVSIRRQDIGASGKVQVKSFLSGTRLSHQVSEKVYNALVYATGLIKFEQNSVAP
jgi:hypothetical protein